MKKLVLTMALVLTSIITFAQTAYEKAMTDKIAQISQCKTPEDFTALSNDFIRIADKEKTQWLPYYYATFATIQNGRKLWRTGNTADLDAIADTAQKTLDKAMALSPDNAENFILEKMIHSLRMMVNPQQRFMSEGALAAQALSKAEKIDPENPRITLLRAQDIYFTPEQFGGSKVKGMELFQKSLEQFKAYQPATQLSPNWGQAEAEYFIANKP